MQTPTQQYTRLHRAFMAAAQEHGLTPFAVRVLVAIDDELGPATTTSIAQALAVGGHSMVRRVLVEELYGPDREFVIGEGSDGGPRRRGVMTHLKLTRDGWEVAQDMRAYSDPEAVAL